MINRETSTLSRPNIVYLDRGAFKKCHGEERKYLLPGGLEPSIIISHRFMISSFIL